MPSRPCIVCGELGAGSYCNAHRPKSRGLDPRRKNGWAAQRWAQKVKAQTGGRCARCGSTDRVQAHHLHAIGAGGAADGTGVALCAHCHRRVHTAQSE